MVTYFCANRRKLAYPTFILCAGIPQRMGGPNMDAPVTDDLPAYDQNWVNFGAVTP